MCPINVWDSRGLLAHSADDVLRGHPQRARESEQRRQARLVGTQLQLGDEAATDSARGRKVLLAQPALISESPQHEPERALDPIPPLAVGFGILLFGGDSGHGRILSEPARPVYTT